VTLNNIEVTFPGGGTKAEGAKSDFPELENVYPEYFMWGVLPAYGLYARHARGLTLNNVRFDLAEPDLRPAVVCDDVDDLEMAGLKAQANPNAESLLRLRATRGAFIHTCRPLGEADTFLRVEAPGSANISLAGNKLNGVRKAVIRTGGAGPVDLSLQPNASE
jgi:hypothetical protein